MKKLISIERTTKDLSYGRFRVSTLKILGIPVISRYRGAHVLTYLCGIPLFSKGRLLYERAEHQYLFSSINAGIARVPPAEGVLRLMQLTALHILLKIDEVCQRHGLQYWLDYGTLLGAKRHKGFIPWDDDLDIGMERDDWERLKSILEEEFASEGYHYTLCDIIKIHYKNAPVQVDIFAYDRASSSFEPDSPAEHELAKRLHRAHGQLVYDFNDFVNMFCTSHTYEERRKMHDCDIMQNRQPEEHGNLFLGFDIPASQRITLKEDWLYPLSSIEFEGRKFPCPRMVEMVLYCYYRDWSQYPRQLCTVHINRDELTKSQIETMLNYIASAHPY